jgi:CBS domain-containing protein
VNILKLCDAQSATVSSQTSVTEAIRAMIAHEVGAISVVDENGRLCGIFSERDVLMKLALSDAVDPATTPVRDLMTSPVTTATPDLTPAECLGMMMSGHFRHLPIVTLDGKLVGMLSMRHLLQWRAEDLHRELDALEQYYSNDAPGG